MEEKQVWMEKVVAELSTMDSKMVSLVYFFVIGLKGKRKHK